jgi:hypothetical protein
VWLGLVPWTVPCLGFVIALVSRGCARFVLHRQPARKNLGYQVLALATLLGTGQIFGIARYGEELGAWTLNTSSWAWPLVSLILLQLAQQIAITPLLIDKFPVPRPANPLPLLVLVPMVGLVLWS